jgi:hypothetical protein
MRALHHQGLRRLLKPTPARGSAMTAGQRRRSLMEIAPIALRRRVGTGTGILARAYIVRGWAGTA